MIGFALKGPKNGVLGAIFGVGAKYLVGSYIRPQNCAFLDISGPDLTRRVVAFCICHR